MEDIQARDLIDWDGTRHTPARGDARILSLVPSLTELLFDLGLGAQVVGRTHYCIHPADRVAHVASVGGTKKIKMDRVRDLSPTHALVNIDENTESMADDLRQAGITVVVTHPVEVRDNLRLFGLVGCLFGAEAAARGLADKFETAARELGNPPPRRVLYLIWREPWMTVGPDTYVSRLLARIDWRTVPEMTEVRYPEIDLAGGLLDDVDLVLMSSEPYTFTSEHADQFGRDHPAHAHKVRLVDGEMLSWYGSRAIAGLQYLKDLAVAERSRS